MTLALLMQRQAVNEPSVVFKEESMHWVLCTWVVWLPLPFLGQRGGYQGRGHERGTSFLAFWDSVTSLLPCLNPWPPLSLMPGSWLSFFCPIHRKTREAFVSLENTCKSMKACRAENCSVKTDTVESALIGTRLRPRPGKLNSSCRCSALAVMGRITF